MFLFLPVLDVLCFVLGPLGLVFSGIGYNSARRTGGRIGLAGAGLALSTSTVGLLILFMVLVAVGAASWGWGP